MKFASPSSLSSSLVIHLHNIIRTNNKQDDDDFICHFILFSVILLILLQILLAHLLLPKSNSRKNNNNNNKDNSIRRGVQHATTGLTFVFLSYIIPKLIGSMLILIASIILYTLHRLRLKSPTIQKIYLQLFGSLLRPHERKNQAPGAFYFLLGTGITFLLTPKMNVARTAILCLSIADPLAGISGRLIGGPFLIMSSGSRSNKKTLVGCFTYFISCILICYATLTLNWNGIIVVAMVSTVTEALAMTVVRIDDNLLIPTITSLIICMVQFVS